MSNKCSQKNKKILKKHLTRTNVCDIIKKKVEIVRKKYEHLKTEVKIMRLTLRGKIVLTIISILIISLTVILSVNTGFATREDSQVNYTFYTVKSTDTLWSIACQHTEDNKDVRETLYEIKKVNDITENELRPGMRLAIFK